MNDAEFQNSPIAWFALLERARMTGDQKRGDEALRQLRRLGVEVKFDKPEPETSSA